MTCQPASEPASRLQRHDRLGQRLARRPFLLGLLLAACGLPTPGPAPTPVPATQAPSAPPTPVVPSSPPPPAPTVALPVLPPGARPGGRVVEGVTQLPASLNPLLADDAVARRLAALLHDGLVRLHDDTHEAGPALAERWESADDGRLYTFRLRRGLTFHDGRALTAADVVATYQAVAADRGLSLRAATLAGVLDTIVAQGDVGVEVRLRQPYAPFLAELATLPILPAAHVSGGLEASTAGSAPIGAGPFRLGGRGADQVTLRRFTGYWAGAPLLDEIELRRVADGDAQVAGLASGALDLAEFAAPGLTPPLLVRLRATTGLSLVPLRSLETTFLVFQLDPGRSAALADGRVRRGLAHAVDRAALVGAATHGLGELIVGTLPPASWAASKDVEPAYAFEPARAASLLDAAGWPRGDDGLRRREGQPLAVTLLTNAGNPVRAALLAGIADAWRAIGVSVTARQEPFAAAVERLQQGDFEVAIIGLDLGADPDQRWLWESRSTRGGYNFNRYSNAQVDRLLIAARATTDRDARRRLYDEVQRAVLTDLPALPLGTASGLLAVGSRLRNCVPSTVDGAHGAARWWVAG